MTFIANYIKRNQHTETTHPYVNLKLVFLKVASSHPLDTLNIYTAELPPPSAPAQVMAYADDITITYTHTSTSAARKYISPHLQKVFVWTKQNNLTLNPDKTTCILFTPDPAEYRSNLDLKINNIALLMTTHSRFWVSP